MRRWLLGPRGAAGLEMLAVGMLCALIAGFSGAASSVEQPSEGAQLQALVERLFATAAPGSDLELPAVHLLPGQVPADLPADLLIPAGSRVVGSVVRDSGGQRTSWQVVLDVPGTPSEVLALYYQALTARGWLDPFSGTARPAGGFKPEPIIAPVHFLCQSSGGPMLTLNLRSVTPNLTAVQLHLDTVSAGPCSGLPRPGEQSGREAAGPGLLPPLYAPADVQVHSLASFRAPLPGEPERVVSEAVVYTARSVGELADHYAQQLAAAGWTRLDGGGNGRLAWSAWRLPGEDIWQGWLYVADGPGAGQRWLEVRAQSTSTAPWPGASSPQASVPAAPPAAP